MKAIKGIRKKLKSCSGISMGELLTATLILLLVSQVVAAGVSFGTRSYHSSITQSESRTLCAALTSAIEGELRFASSIAPVNADGTFDYYFSRTIGGKTDSSITAVDEDDQETDAGDLAIFRVNPDTGVRECLRLVASATYSSYQLKARPRITWNTAGEYFHVELDILDSEDTVTCSEEFDVIPALYDLILR